MKKNKIKIEQKDGNISVYRNDELDWQLNANRLVDNVKAGKTDAIRLANLIAEFINDCLNCKTASSSLKDLNNKQQYTGTYFEHIDHFTD